MTNKDTDGLFDGDGDEKNELFWTEADWEAYLAEHETAVRDYLRHYDSAADIPERIDEVARRMGWEIEPSDELSAETPSPDIEDGTEPFPTDWEPYTLHRNPVYIATKALYVGLLVNWERIAVHADRVPQALALTLQSSLYRGRENALQAVQALDLGDYALAICFFKRALKDMNDALARLNQSEPAGGDDALLQRFREYALPRLFDLREIWLRVMNECRQAQRES
jgi:hypothetical protein